MNLIGASSELQKSEKFSFQGQNFQEKSFCKNRYNCNDFFLALKVLEAYKIRFHYVYDKLSSLSNSRTRLLPHQIEATYRVITSLKPRFLLADEVGLGKTIEAGLIMKELMLRKEYQFIIIVVPAPLQIQWQQEMKNKFNENFMILNYKSFNSFINNYKNYRKIITSIDFIKNPKYYEPLFNIPWQFAIFDEAHRLRKDYHKVTQAYRFAEKMANQVESLLLLSATPFRGKIEELYFLIRLLDPYLLGPENSFFQEFVIPARNGKSIKQIRNRVDKIIIRRRKIEVGGFTRRIAKTIRFELSNEERTFYDATTEYVKKEYNLSRKLQNRAIGFIMIVFQKLLDSSTKALLKALEKRKRMLETKLYKIRTSFSYMEYSDIEECIEYSENEEEILESISGIEEQKYLNIQDIRKEIMTLSHLISLGRQIQIDTKVIKLKETIESLKTNGHDKIIIFTQFRTTQDYLLEILNSYRCNVFHGSLSSEQKEQEIQEFKEKGEILICTEAGGEGRNMQFADVLINYDLPWSPLKMEQRIGRIHRFGQKKDVLILNFATRNTVAERVLDVLEHKIKIFEESIGPSDMLLGSIEDEVNLGGFLMDFISGKITQKELENNIEVKIENAKRSYQLLNELVSPSVVDFNLLDYYRITKQERNIDNLHIEKLVSYYLKENKNTKYQLKKIKNSSSKEKLYHLNPENKIAVFDAEVALENENYVFLAIGHPLVDEAIEYYVNHPFFRSIIKVRSSFFEKGIYFIFILEYHSGKEKKEIIAVRTSSLLSKEYEILEKFETKELFMNPQKIKKSHIESIDDWELETLENIADEISRWLIKQIKNKKSYWFHKMEDIHKQELYKLEISFGKKIRNLEEKKDIEKLRYKMNPTSTRKAVLTRTENAIQNAKKELERQIRKLQSQTLVHIKVELFQIYWMV